MLYVCMYILIISLPSPIIVIIAKCDLSFFASEGFATLNHKSRTLFSSCLVYTYLSRCRAIGKYVHCPLTKT